MEFLHHTKKSWERGSPGFSDCGCRKLNRNGEVSRSVKEIILGHADVLRKQAPMKAEDDGCVVIPRA